MSAPASISWRVPSAVTTLPATIFDVGQRGPDRSRWPERAGLVPVRRVDDEDVRTEGDEILGPHRGIAVDPDRGADQQPPVGVDGRTVDGRAQRTLAGDHADQAAVVVDDRGHTETLSGRVARTPPRGRRRAAGGAGSWLITLPSWVNRSTPSASFSVNSPTGAPVVDDDHRAVRPLVDQRQRVADRGVGREGDRRFEDRVTALDVLDDAAHDVDGDVLRQDGDPAAAGDGLGHAATGDGGHVRDDEGNRGADTVGGREVDVHARRDVGEARHHEDVVVGQVVADVGVEQSHRASRSLSSEP